MNNYEILFQKVTELTEGDPEAHLQPTVQELEELEELRRFSAELREPEPLSMTSTV